MAQYRINAYANRTGKLTETKPSRSRSAALAEGLAMKAAGKHKVITLLRDSEGTDHPANAGKFFLDQIIK
jgi:hypothetical protein